MEWILMTPPPGPPPGWTAKAGIGPILWRVLFNRGVAEEAAAELFLNPRLSQFASPLSLPGVAAAADRLVTAIRKREKIIVFGDYDADGITSVALLLSFFRDLGLAADFMLPSRFEEGYGLSPAAAREAADQGCTLLVTVDCGTTSVEEVAYLRSRGVDVVVTDHHRLGEALPGTDYLINPQMWQGENSGYQVLAGVGVAFMLVMAATIRMRDDPVLGPRLPPLRGYLDLVTVGTVADVVPLVGVNRTLVRHGLALLANERPRPGIAALREHCGLADKPLDCSAISFYLAPRLNAAGRIGRADAAVDLLLSPALGRALALASQLEQDNQQRKELEGGILEEAEQLVAVATERGDSKAIVLASAGWHKGVLGIVASRLSEKYHRPAVLMAVEGGVATGSGRSVAGFNIGAALERCAHLLVRCGGHSMAAGLTVELAHLDEFRAEFERLVAESAVGGDREPTLVLDGWLDLADVDLSLATELARVAPFGAGNREPVFAVADLVVRSVQHLRGEHLRLALEREGRRVDAIGFRMGGMEVPVGAHIDIAFTPEERHFGGIRNLQLRLRDLRVHRESAS